MSLIWSLENESILKIHIQNLENNIILETCTKAKGMVVHNIFNINLIKFGQLDITKEKESVVTLLILMKTFDSMTWTKCQRLRAHLVHVFKHMFLVFK